MSAGHPRPCPPPRQRGSMTVAVVFAVLVAAVLLGVLQLGYGAYMKHEMQKAPRISL